MNHDQMQISTIYLVNLKYEKKWSYGRRDLARTKKSYRPEDNLQADSYIPPPNIVWEEGWGDKYQRYCMMMFTPGQW